MLKYSTEVFNSNYLLNSFLRTFLISRSEAPLLTPKTSYNLVSAIFNVEGRNNCYIKRATNCVIINVNCQRKLISSSEYMFLK